MAWGLRSASAAALVSMAAAAAVHAAPAQARGFALRELGRFRAPIYVTAPPRDRSRVFVVERRGRVMVVRHGRKLRRPFLDISRHVVIRARRIEDDHGGLLSIAFARDYAASGRFYAFYTRRPGRIEVDEFRRSRASSDRADPRSRRTIFALPLETHFDIGGQLAVGPDGMLYAGFGADAGARPDPSHAQDPASLAGKLVRVDPEHPGAGRPYGIPAGNPFPAVPGTLPEVYASGLRTPWRFSFDPPTGDLVIGDVGEARTEEIDVLHPGQAGANFGWDLFEGDRRLKPGAVPGLVAPAVEEQHGPRGFCAIIGGYVVRDRSLPSLYGRYLYGDLCTGRLRSVALGTARPPRSEGGLAPPLVSFGQDAASHVYAVALSGAVMRLVPR